MRVWVDQDLCTGDGLCTDHCPDLFVLLEDGLSYVRDAAGSAVNDPGGRGSIQSVPDGLVDQTIAADLDCPGECIFVEDDVLDDTDDWDVGGADVAEAEVVDGTTGW